MYPQYGFNPRSQPEKLQSSGLGTLCALAALGLIYTGFTANPGARPLEFFGGLLIAGVGAFCNVGACAFTSASMGRVMRRPMRFNSGWLLLMLLGDGGLFWGFHKLGTAYSTGWLWIAVGFVVLIVGLACTVLTSTANATSRRSIGALY